MRVIPLDHFCNWQQDPQGNYQARLVFPKPAKRMSIIVDLVADLTAINPFDFFLERYADNFPFEYEPQLGRELAAYLETPASTEKVDKWVASVDRTSKPTMDAITSLNHRLQGEIRYKIRMEAGVQSPEETLTSRTQMSSGNAWMIWGIGSTCN